MFAANLYRVRHATDADVEVIHRLASLDSATPISGRALIGEIDGTPAVVLSMTTGQVTADPFRRTDHLVSFMRVQAVGVRSAEEMPSLRERIRAAMRRPGPVFATA